MFKSSKQKLFIALLGVFLVKQIFWLTIIPPTQAPDEYAHFSYVESWYYEDRLPKLGKTLITKRIEEASQGKFEENKVPYQPGSQLNWIAQHPPFYYYLLKIFYPLVAGMDANSGIFCLRFISIIFGLLTVTLAYLIAKKLQPNNEWLPLLVAGFIAFLPDFSFISAVLNNDNLVLCLSTGLVYVVTLLITESKGELDQKFYTNAGLIAVLIGLLLITKATSLPVVVATVLFEVYYLLFEKRLNWFELSKFFFMQVAIIMPISGWWYIHNYQEFHLFLPDITTVIQMHPEMLSQHEYLKTMFPEVMGMKNLISPYNFFITKNFFWNYFVNIWGVFGSGFITLGLWQILSYTTLIIAATISSIKEKLEKKLESNRSKINLINTYFVLLTTILFAAITYKLFQIAQSRGFLGAMHGRYFLPAMIPIGYWIILGIQQLFKNRQSTWVVTLLFLFLVANELLTISFVIIPSFY